MKIARVCGTVTSTQKEDTLTGVKFLVLQYLGEDHHHHHGEFLPDYEVAADTVGAGQDEWVLVSRGSAARHIINGTDKPIDAAVVAIIDTVSRDNYLLYSKRTQY
uniref:Carboxysome shell vertex protein CcmL n=1 Tax=Thermosynechococcus vestitus (strain NIES-2133 / IAM M-273 / BP-1) TaxID=197221 RepID=UPI001EF1613D|nr:Chain A, Carboxysome shell vertex protein CcmL [Thermosynechococcus vestitus BP-1]7WKC_B Chain B, Carboxysome shell vertex protein CcmL [Thermosynechococcus vestitus BP-1]7WKC_C Chain C, Carboxysome shell vertex protein CcmL [Thermosynechococcus vestitus BP-1]7WKC_D Chain D, Carboxysome shell vertex protein CcmL [Thermosynechococcus vestitus BP-1]7WKC_E Chain E, Carboxysome shell vertex protein CcmL [Thermosynechococcus vestitus BP-1]